MLHFWKVKKLNPTSDQVAFGICSFPSFLLSLWHCIKTCWRLGHSARRSQSIEYTILFICGGSSKRPCLHQNHQNLSSLQRLLLPRAWQWAREPSKLPEYHQQLGQREEHPQLCFAKVGVNGIWIRIQNARERRMSTSKRNKDPTIETKMNNITYYLRIRNHPLLLPVRSMAG